MALASITRVDDLQTRSLSAVVIVVVVIAGRCGHGDVDLGRHFVPLGIASEQPSFRDLIHEQQS